MWHEKIHFYPFKPLHSDPEYLHDQSQEKTNTMNYQFVSYQPANSTVHDGQSSCWKRETFFHNVYPKMMMMNQSSREGSPLPSSPQFPLSPSNLQNTKPMSARVNKPEKMKKQVKRRNDAKQFESLLYMGMNGISELKWVPFNAAVVKRKEKKVAPQTVTISPAVVLPQKKGRTSLSIRELLN